MSSEIDTRYVPTEHQLADIFTKGFSRDRFQYLCSKLKLVDSPQFSLRGNDKITYPRDSNKKPTSLMCMHLSSGDHNVINQDSWLE